MNKVLKGLVAVVSTAAMAVAGFAGAASAMAADPTGSIKVAAEDTHTYSVYQIFTGTYGTDGSLGNVEAGKNFNTANKAGTSGADLTAAEAAKAVSQLGSGASDSKKLETINKFVNLDGEAFGTVSATKPLNSVPAGYYLAKDSETVTGDDAATLYIVQVIGNQPVTITRKVDKPTFQKKVQDINDSTDTTTTDWQDSADYDVNDEVPFQLTATLPANAADFAAYETYKLVFHDNQSAGLTFKPETVVVKYGDKTLGAGSYTVTENPEDKDTFDITITNAKAVNDANGNAITVAAGGEFTVEYKSELNENAVIGAVGNPNEAYLEFSNNPNVGGESNTGKTTPDKVIVFTYQLDINKTFNGGTPDDNDLPKFRLYKFDKEANAYSTDLGEVNITKTADGKYTASFKRVDDGKYKLVETKTPAGFNTAADTTFEITAVHEVTSDDPELTSLKIKINSTEVVAVAGTVVADVVNQKGSNLPSTGGMGTTVLYAAGAAIVLVAAFGIAFAVRRRNAR